MAEPKLAEQVLRAFRRACRDGRLDVAEHLFAALELMGGLALRHASHELETVRGSDRTPTVPKRSRH